MAEHPWCAVVVTYHPEATVAAHLRSLRSQCPNLLVVDNGSEAAALKVLAAVCGELGITLLQNIRNLGIATALNQGIRWARDIGATFIFFFDQDSAMPEHFCNTMLACFEQHSASHDLGILVPRYVDQRDGTVLYPPGTPGGELNAATTSGSLTPMHVFDRIGEFAEELFIDGVDYEFSLRARAHGLSIRECAAAMLLHNPGATTTYRLLGLTTFRSSNYSPARRYFQTRNRLWVTRRYWRTFPSFCLWQLWVGLKDFAKTAIAEEDRRRKLRFFWRGLLDGLRGHSGRLPE